MASRNFVLTGQRSTTAFLQGWAMGGAGQGLSSRACEMRRREARSADSAAVLPVQAPAAEMGRYVIRLPGCDEQDPPFPSLDSPRTPVVSCRRRESDPWPAWPLKWPACCGARNKTRLHSRPTSTLVIFVIIVNADTDPHQLGKQGDQKRDLPPPLPAGQAHEERKTFAALQAPAAPSDRREAIKGNAAPT